MHRMRFRDPAGAVRTGEYEDGTVSFGGRTYDTSDVDVLPPCEPSKVVCIGRNYAKHAEERGSEVPDRPMLFLKPPNALAGHGDTVTLPAGKEIEHEAELAVVVGEQCRNLDESEAMDAVAGSPARTTSRTAPTRARSATGCAGRPSTAPARSAQCWRHPKNFPMTRAWNSA